MWLYVKKCKTYAKHTGGQKCHRRTVIFLISISLILILYVFWTEWGCEMADHLKGSHSSHGQLTALTLALSPISTLFIDLPLKPREKSIAIYFPSHIYPLQSLTISFSPWAANYRETPTTSWAVICGAADPHPLDLLSLSLSETASLSPINSSI